MNGKKNPCDLGRGVLVELKRSGNVWDKEKEQFDSQE